MSKATDHNNELYIETLKQQNEKLRKQLLRNMSCKSCGNPNPNPTWKREKREIIVGCRNPWIDKCVECGGGLPDEFVERDLFAEGEELEWIHAENFYNNLK